MPRSSDRHSERTRRRVGLGSAQDASAAPAFEPSADLLRQLMAGVGGAGCGSTSWRCSGSPTRTGEPGLSWTGIRRERGVRGRGPARRGPSGEHLRVPATETTAPPVRGTLVGISLQMITSSLLVTAGLFCLALYFAGVGSRQVTYRRRTRR